MNKLSNFLWRLFSTMMVFGWDTTRETYAFTSDIYESSSTSGQKIILCPSGQYVYSCGNRKVGYNWLKNVALPFDATKYVTTQNYLVDGNNINKLEQMRAFFNNQPLLYDNTCKVVSGTESSCDGTITSTPTLPKTSDISNISDIDMILGYMCNPLTNTDIKCTSCPNNAYVEESYVEQSIGTTNKLVSDSWHFHTIADCYLTRFEDQSGTFIFVTDMDSSTDFKDGDPCYYSNDSTAYAGDDVSYATTANSSYYQPTTSGKNY